jgi:hypothetical protein
MGYETTSQGGLSRVTRKRSRTVLRGEGGRESPNLPDQVRADMVRWLKLSDRMESVKAVFESFVIQGPFLLLFLLVPVRRLLLLACFCWSVCGAHSKIDL